MDTPPRGWVGSKGFGEKVGFQVGFGEKSGIWGKSWRESGIRVDFGEEVSAAVGGRKTHFTRRKALRNRIFFSVLVVESTIFSRLRRKNQSMTLSTLYESNSSSPRVVTI